MVTMAAGLALGTSATRLPPTELPLLYAAGRADPGPSSLIQAYRFDLLLDCRDCLQA